MAEFVIEKAYKRAISRWTKILWPKESFARHVDSVRSKDVEPVYMEDLYLAGAAGFRVDPAWEVIDAELSGRLKNSLSHMPLADMTPDDVWSETLARVIDEDAEKDPLPDGRRPARIIRYRGLVKLLNYLIVISKRIAITRNRKKKPDYFLSAMEGFDKAAPNPADSPEKRLITNDTMKLIFDQLSDAYKNLTTEQRFLIMMVYRKGMRQKQAGKMIGFSESKTTRHIKKAITIIKQSFAETEGVDLTEDVERAFSGLWSKAWADETV
jgi:RNA polymerase sigma-70 factor (ECF subfamily)